MSSLRILRARIRLFSLQAIIIGRLAFQVESTSNVREGGECMPPYHINSYDQILVNAFTGEIIPSTYESECKGVTIDEAIEIAKNNCEYIDFDSSEE